MGEFARRWFSLFDNVNKRRVTPPESILIQYPLPKNVFYISIYKRHLSVWVSNPRRTYQIITRL